MSVRAITAAYAVKAGGASNKAVLVALADHANDADECWPSISKLAEKTELHIDTVKRCLRNLEQRGLIGRTARYHDGTKYRRTDIYKLRLTSRRIRPYPRMVHPCMVRPYPRIVQWGMVVWCRVYGCMVRGT